VAGIANGGAVFWKPSPDEPNALDGWLERLTTEIGDTCWGWGIVLVM
jgi:hypothetical protein